jgi:hypothetical protein
MIPELNEPLPPQGGGAPRVNVVWGWDDWWLARVRATLRRMNPSVPRENRRVVAREMHEDLDHLVAMAEKEWRRR